MMIIIILTHEHYCTVLFIPSLTFQVSTDRGDDHHFAHFADTVACIVSLTFLSLYCQLLPWWDDV